MKIPYQSLYLAILFKNELLKECLGINYTAQQVFDELDVDISNNFY